MESKADDRQPFLGFRDDPAARDSIEDSEMAIVTPDDQKVTQSGSQRSRLFRDAAVSLATSAVWAVIFFLFMHNTRSSSLRNMGSKNAISGDYLAAFHNVTSAAQYISCGNSTAEAKRNGCRYDTLLNYWVHERCFDQEFETEYQDDDSWAAFADRNLSERIAPEDMGDQEIYYTSIRDHLNHCSMLWKKQFWTLFEDRAAFDGVIVNSFHTEHCADFLKDMYGSDRTEPTLVRVGFSGCWVKE
ncbi:uncharacterized protein LY79DRAFT_570603 [Colletotrichum navitas]|uniref:Uncharacterized protein n=1 Tax=Colletotrichum navitas TaxID=681940 RepID=A0AAD8PLR6_9PEZI|nr:uncharacterized protein LY79DRAFT_570603 [Colletotrichum navitas]KAK1570059.1 hypothetical protein LY79DRAFT_570603 [Colletotrichum navitas]